MPMLSRMNFDIGLAKLSTTCQGWLDNSHCWFSQIPIKETDTKFWYSTIPWGDKPAIWWQVDHYCTFIIRWASDLFVLEHQLTPKLVLPSLPTILLKQPWLSYPRLWYSTQHHFWPRNSPQIKVRKAILTKLISCALHLHPKTEWTFKLSVTIYACAKLCMSGTVSSNMQWFLWMSVQYKMLFPSKCSQVPGNKGWE
jgi:hypothetical protein